MPDPLHDLIPHFDPIDAHAIAARAHRQRRTTVLVAGAAIVMVGVISAAAVVPSVTGRTATPMPAETASVATVPPSAVATPIATPSAFTSAPCGLTALPATWSSALAVPTWLGGTHAQLLSHDATTGRSLYWLASSSSVVVSDPSGGRRTLFSLTRGEIPYRAALEGDWAVLEVGSTPNFGVVGIYARKVDGSGLQTVVKDAVAGAGTVEDNLVLHSGVVYFDAFEQKADPKALLVAYDLASQTSTHREVPLPDTPLVRWGNTLVWSAYGTKATTMVDLTTLADVPVPPAIAGHAAGAWFASDGETIVWRGHDDKIGDVMAYREGWSGVRVQRVSTTPGEVQSVWGRYAIVEIGRDYSILDLETGQSAPVDGHRNALVSGGRLAVFNVADAHAPLYELDLTTVPALPGCTR